MTINLQKPDIRELKPKIVVFGVGGGGGNAVNNMINGGLEGVEFVVANTDAQALTMSKAERVIQLGHDSTQGLGAGSQPDIGRIAAEECIAEIQDHLAGTNMAFVTAGMGGGTGTGAAPVVARAAREMGILTVGVVTKPFQFEGGRRMTTADEGIIELQKNVDTLIVIPNQNLFRIANDKTTFADAFGMADQVLYSGVACITDLMVKEGLINLDFADVRSVMHEMGKAMMGTGESSGEGRAMQAAEAAISNPLLDETSMQGAQGLLISITGGRDMTLFEVDEAATRIREEVDTEANIIVGATFDEELDGIFRVSVVATGIDNVASETKAIPQPIKSSAQPTPASIPSMLGLAAKTPTVSAPAPATASVEDKVAKTAEALEIPQAKAASTSNGVRIEPLKREIQSEKADFEDDFKSALEEELMPKSESFVPAAAQTPDSVAKSPVAAQPKVPAVEEFPAIARDSVKAAAAPKAPHDGGPMSLLQKLKSGLGVGDSASQQSERVDPVATERTEQPPVKVEPATPQPVQSQKLQEDPYAPKRGNLDQTGRVTPSVKSLQEDDQLDIPAFLRRQAN